MGPPFRKNSSFNLQGARRRLPDCHPNTATCLQLGCRVQAACLCCNIRAGIHPAPRRPIDAFRSDRARSDTWCVVRAPGGPGHSRQGPAQSSGRVAAQSGRLHKRCHCDTDTHVANAVGACPEVAWQMQCVVVWRGWRPRTVLRQHLRPSLPVAGRALFWEECSKGFKSGCAIYAVRVPC